MNKMYKEEQGGRPTGCTVKVRTLHKDVGK